MVALDWFIQRDLQVCLTTTRIIACVVSALHSLIHWGHEGVICCLTVWNYTDYFHCSLSQHFSSSWLLVQHWELGQDSMFSRTSRPLPSLPLTPPHSPSLLHSISLYGGQIWEASFRASCISSLSADVWAVFAPVERSLYSLWSYRITANAAIFPCMKWWNDF